MLIPRKTFTSLRSIFNLTTQSTLFNRRSLTMTSNEALIKDKEENKIVDDVAAERDEICSNAKKQKIETPDTTIATTTTVGEETDSSQIKQLKKRKYALLLGYSGEGYYGLQRYYF